MVKEDASPDLKVETVGDATVRASDLRQRDATLGTVIENRVLTTLGTPEKRHIGRLSCSWPSTRF